MINVMARKLVAASISGSIYAILLGLLLPNYSGGFITSLQDYFLSAILLTPVYLMYSFPVIVSYGVLTSMISDKASQIIASKLRNDRLEIIISGLLHILFGLILLLLSLGAALLFFIVDHVLQKYKKEVTWVQAVKSLAIPVGVWLFAMASVWISSFINAN